MHIYIPFLGSSFSIGKTFSTQWQVWEIMCSLKFAQAVKPHDNKYKIPY